MAALLNDDDVGLAAPAPQDNEPGPRLQTDADVGLVPAADFGDALSHTHQAINAVKRFTGLGDQPPDDVHVPSVLSVMKAFGHEAKDAWGPEKLGISDASAKILSEQGWFRKEGRDSYNPFGAFNELLFHTVAGAGDMLLRSGTALFRGAQGAVAEAGLPRDLAALPEAFFGMPHPTGIPQGFPAVKVREPPPGMKITVKAGGLTSEGVVSLEPSFTAEVHGIEAFHGSPHDFEAFSMDKIGTGEGAQSYGHGLYFAEHPDVAEGYAKKLADVTATHEEMVAGEPSLTRPNTYKVRINVDREHFLDWDRPLSEQSEHVQEALRKIGVKPDTGPDIRYEPFDKARRDGMIAARGRNDSLLGTINVNRDPEGGFRVIADEGRRKLNEIVPTLDDAKELIEEFSTEYARSVKRSPGEAVYRELQSRLLPTKEEGRDLTGGDRASAILRDAGIPGIKYLDQGSRGTDPGIAEALKKSIETREAGLSSRSNAADLEALLDDKKRLDQMLNPTSNFVLFDDKLVQITHKNGIPIPDVQLAKDLGIIGPERSPITEGTPEEAARRTVAAERIGDEKITGEVGEGANPWQERFEQFVGKLEAPEDVKQLIRDAAADNGDFIPARQGDIPLGQVEDIAAAAGVAPEEINQKGLGRLLHNDQQVRAAMQMMLQVTKNVTDAARDVRADASAESLIKLQEAIMRRDLAIEQVVGLRAEWGRTGNVFQEFLRDVKDAEGLTNFLRDKGKGTDGLRHVADALNELDGAQAGRFLNDLRTPSAWDKFMFYWVNALISGPVTHTKYIIANAAFAAYESAVVTPIAGALGTVRRAVSGGTEGVYLGEAGARLWGIVAGVPDALVAAAKAARTGLQTALPGEIAQNIIPKQQRTIAFQQKPIPGALGTAIGIPSRGASAIHSFFNFLGYRASVEAQAYRGAAKEGLKPTEDAFWQRRADLADKPDIEEMNSAIEEGYRLTFINELSPGMKAITKAVRASKIGQLALPFLHIPFNILARGIEGNVVLAGLSAETRAALSGEHGVVKQDMATARLIAGSAVGVWAVNLVANDRMTGFGPTEPKERDQWLATGHQPYSIRIGDYWYSFNRFGPLGTMLGIHANLAEAIPHMKPEAEELTKALTMTVHATGRLLEDEVGMQGLAGLIEAINEPERKGQRFVSNFAGSLMPYSSLLRQTASAMDPEMREAKSLVDGLRYYIPAVRQGLLPKRDWTGNPIANAGYGGDIPGAPGVSAIIQHRQVGTDPIAFEMKALDLHPAKPQDRIGGVKLPAAMYDRYQSIAGPMTRHALEQAVDMPGWYDLPTFVRQQVFQGAIRASREAAQSIMQVANPSLINQGVENRVNRIEGRKPTKLKE